MNLARYLPEPPLPLHGRPFRFLLVARMLKDKGIEEFVEAARLVRREASDTVFQLLGFTEPANPNSVSLDRIKQWECEGVIQYLGKTDDVRPYVKNADCIVLPSYREGVPRSLIEAAAMARPIITTDVIGCRDVVDDNVNGLLCQARDARDLGDKLLRMIRLTPEKRLQMGVAGRRKVETEFDEKLVIQKYLQALDRIASLQGRLRENPLHAAHGK